MPVLVNQSKTALLIGCSRNNINKKWKVEQENPGTHDYFSESGNVDISHHEFISLYGDHLNEWKSLKDKPRKSRSTNNQKSETEKVSIKENQAIPEKTSIHEKQKTKKQLEQIEIEKEKNIHVNDETKALAEKAKKAKYIKTINDAKKSQIELDKSRSLLIEIETLAETCMGYLATLNQNIMQVPETFVDEFEASMKAGKTRTDKIDILRIPICAFIAETIEGITNEIDKERKKSYRHEKKKRAPEKL
ncbi:hypothetical protein KAR91_73615 [Candidatus Pacearchaeota archaeon]|nr:hypothetical protein [Candidatus Pacearchaeota archaeon]